MSETDPRDALYERGPAILEPDTLLGSQYFDRLRQRAGSGERALIVAILEDAVNVYLQHAAATASHNQRLFEEAEQWIEDHDPTWIFSFDSICDLLGLDADYLRGGLRAAKIRARDDRRGVEISVASSTDHERRRASGA